MDDESDAEMPGLKLKLDLKRIVSYFIVQVQYMQVSLSRCIKVSLSSCINRLKARMNMSVKENCFPAEKRF